MKNVFYEEDGDFKVGAELSSTGTSLQVEAPHGKRSKIKAAQVLLRFGSPLAEFLPRVEALAADIDIDFLWSCCSQDEFGFTELAAEYYGVQASLEEQAAIAQCLHRAPMYFYRKGRGRYKAAPEEALKAALAGLERKQREQQQIDAWVAELQEGRVPSAWHSMLAALVTRPDKNTLEYKALDAACRMLGESPLRLIAARGGIESIPDFLLSAFILEHFPRGGEFGGYASPALPTDLPLADVVAFSIDDATTTEIDDAFSLTWREDGSVRLGVHIAAPALVIGAQSELEKIIFQRLSTVYYPGGKMTMLPPDVIAQFSLDAGRATPAVSMYFDLSPEFEILQHQTIIEAVNVTQNLRIDALEPFFNEENLCNESGETYPFKRELSWLWHFANHLEARRGKADPTRPPQIDYGIELDGERVRITSRVRGAPIDKVVSELMILVNSTWGQALSNAGIGALYRTQTVGKVRMSTSPAPHVGLGVEFYTWASSPLRRAVDFVNQRQIIAWLRHETPRFGRNDAELFAVLRDFDVAYTAYGQFQSQMERYWCLRWLQQEQCQELIAVLIKEDLVRVEGLPLTFRVSGIPAEVAAGMRIQLHIVEMDLLSQHLACRFIALCGD